MTSHPRRRLPRRLTEAVGAIVAVGVVLLLSASGLGAVPALGPLLNTGTGVWRLSPDTSTPQSQTATFAALDKPGMVSFESNGDTHITAGTDQDLFRLMGYVDSQFRLQQMDLERRQGNSQLAAILGHTGLDSDTFELDLGVARAAQRDWNQMAAGDPARQALVSYAEGVNAGIGKLESAHQLPATFKLLGYQPARWTPEDSLVIQRVMTQTLSFTDTPLTFSYAAKALPTAVFKAWYPDVSDNPQVPYDTGPFQNLPLTSLPVRADDAPGGSPGTAGAHALGTPSSTVTTDAMAGLPVNALHYVGNSNAWVIAGSHTQSGKPILAGDPHLQLTLPSNWYQIEGTSPGYHFTGVTIPGIPVPLLGKTDSFAWSVTDAQRPTTLYYLEKTDPARPGQYFYQGAWHTMATETYSIDVKGEGSVTHVVKFAAQGPMVTLQGVTAALWWAGTLPSDNIDDVLQMLHATSFAQFKASLSGWATPTLNFLYAGNNGDIGAISPGASPQVPGHDIGLPLPGDGSADVAGGIPYSQLPTAFNPPSGFIVSANNREVSADYPYQFSSSYNYADAGYRAQEIAEHLSQPGLRTLQESEQLQLNVEDSLAQGLVPEIVKAMSGTTMTSEEQQVLTKLSTWDDQMVKSSPEAYFFQKFIVTFVYLTFEPWWAHYAIPSDPLNELAISPTGGSFSSSIMYGDLESWIQKDPNNAIFSTPDGTHHDATDMIRAAYAKTVASVTKKLGSGFALWDFGQHNERLFPSLLNVDSFNIGPYPSDSDGRTINSGVPVISGDATGGSTLVKGNRDQVDVHMWTIITTGSSWRFDVDFGTGQADAILPGGDSENPISPWYSNNIPLWLNGRTLPVLEGAAATKAAKTQWRFTS